MSDLLIEIDDRPSRPRPAPAPVDPFPALYAADGARARRYYANLPTSSFAPLPATDVQTSIIEAQLAAGGFYAAPPAGWTDAISDVLDRARIAQPAPIAAAPIVDSSQLDVALAAGGIDLAAPEDVEPEPEPEIADVLADAIATGATMAATAGLVRGGVTPDQVRSVGVVAEARANLLVNSERSAAAIGGTTERAPDAPRPAAPETITMPAAFTGPVRQSQGISPTFAATLDAQRARWGTAQRSSAPVQVSMGPARALTHAEIDAQRERETRAQLDREIRARLVDPTGALDGGASIGWHPWPTVRYAALVDACRTVSLAPPSAPSAAAVAGLAVRRMSAASSSRTARYRVDTLRRGSHWRIFRADTEATVGESIGSVNVDVKLEKGKIDVTHDGSYRASMLAVEVREAFTAARAAMEIDGPALARWIAGVLGSLRAIPSSLGRFWIPGASIERWTEIAAAIKPLGLTTTIGRWASVDGIRDDLAEGLRSEVTNQISRITAERDRAREANKSDIGVRGATSAILAVRDLRTKLDTFAPITGPLTDARAQLDAIDASLAPLVDDTALRGAMLECYADDGAEDDSAA